MDPCCVSRECLSFRAIVKGGVACKLYDCCHIMTTGRWEAGPRAASTCTRGYDDQAAHFLLPAKSESVEGDHYGTVLWRGARNLPRARWRIEEMAPWSSVCVSCLAICRI